MSLTRRALLGSFASGSVALSGCLGSTDDTASPADSTTTTQTTTATEAPDLVLAAVDPGTVASDATVAPIGDLLDAVELAEMGGRAELETRDLTLSTFDCITFEGAQYGIDAGTRSGTYINEYDVVEISEPGDREVLEVSNLSAEERSTAESAIENGSYTYDSLDGGFRPGLDAYRHEGALYVFEQTIHADRPTLTLLTFDGTDEGEGCLTLETLPNRANNRLASIAEGHDAEFPMAVPAEFVPDVRPFDYVLTVERCLAVRTRR